MDVIRCDSFFPKPHIGALTISSGLPQVAEFVGSLQVKYPDEVSENLMACVRISDSFFLKFSSFALDSHRSESSSSLNPFPLMCKTARRSSSWLLSEQTHALSQTLQSLTRLRRVCLSTRTLPRDCIKEEVEASSCISDSRQKAPPFVLEQMGDSKTMLVNSKEALTLIPFLPLFQEFWPCLHAFLVSVGRGLDFTQDVATKVRTRRRVKN